MEQGAPIWPPTWPNPEAFFGSLADRLVSVHTRSLLIGLQVIVRFDNGYGANILSNRLKEGLSEVAVLKFSGPGINDFDFVHEGPVADLTWCHTPEEIFRLLAQIVKIDGKFETDPETDEIDYVFTPSLSHR